METLLKIDGMKCDGCVAAVEKSLKAQPAVQKVAVDLKAGSAAVTHENGDVAAFIVAIEDAGFDAAVAPNG